MKCPAVLAFALAALTVGPAPADTAEADAAVEPPANAVTADYIIGPGDVIQVFVWRNADLTVTIPVKPDGRITTPLVEDMVAAGKTTAQLARDVEGVLAQYIRSPQVNIIVTSPQSVFNQVRAIGQLRAPQVVRHRDGLTVLDVILASGGLTEFSAGNRAMVVRESDGKRKEFKVRAKDIVEKGDLSTNLVMQPGDILIVPESRF